MVSGGLLALDDIMDSPSGKSSPPSLDGTAGQESEEQLTQGSRKVDHCITLIEEPAPVRTTSLIIYAHHKIFITGI